MPTTKTTSRYFLLLLILLPWLATFSLPANAQVAETRRSDGRPPAVNCGRARALAAGRISRWRAPTQQVDREALEDTDVLSYHLDFEVSNLDPAGSTCVLTGSNVMTIVSKSASLTEFTFRFRTQYAITGAFVNGSIPVR